MSSAPPGWYVHPHTGTWCWWDGTRWHAPTPPPTPPPTPGAPTAAPVVRPRRPGRRHTGLLVVAVVVVVALVAGAATVGLITLRRSDGQVAVPASVDTSGARTPSSPTEVIAELQRWWANADVPGLRYQPLDASAVLDDASMVSSCGGQPLAPQALSGNAFFCVPDDYVYYDPDFVRELAEEVGPLVPAVVLAHEWGHRIQALSDSFPDSSLATELQADCYAAAWARDEVEDGRVATSDDPLLELYRTAVLIGDRMELGSGDASAHGTGFDRAGAISTGWSRGLDACVELGQDPPATVQGATGAAYVSGSGDLPLEDVVPLAVEMLDESYPGRDLGVDAVQADCDAGSPGADDEGTRACGDGTLAVDEADVGARYRRYGDMAAWEPIVAAYLDEVGAGGGQDAHDCGVGALAGSMLGEGLYSSSLDDTISLSGGDLDEILLQLSADHRGQEAFERIARVRAGFEGGWSACR